MNHKFIHEPNGSQNALTSSQSEHVSYYDKNVVVMVISFISCEMTSESPCSPNSHF